MSTSSRMTAAAVLPPPPSIDGDRANRFRPLTIGAGIVAVAVLGMDDGVVLCPYRRCTGGDCPLCGGTRAAAALLRGDVLGSWARHPLVPILALQVAIGVVVGAVARRAGREPASLRPLLQRVLLANVAAATVIWVARLATGSVAGPAYLDLPF